ncbi:MAG TPA: cyclic nucleotide-binding domain-containing protein [Myxococcota bacterium]|nr:cyclic nucleotide-binding domain-containing protein [Myxococcota bacterium]HNH45986.1 cyclic nucleotide-binding domain-containing protein [Myxococcota bacterium]
MAALIDELLFLPFLRRVTHAEIRSSLPLWTQILVNPGEMLWEQGEPVEELAIVASGELSASVDGLEVGRVLPGELIGEASAFFGGSTRSARLMARKTASVLCLSLDGLATLRQQRNGMYESLLEQALLALVRRIRNTDQKIAQVAEGDQAAPVRTEPSALVRLWKTLVPGGPKGPCPPLEPLLMRYPGLRQVSPEVVATIAASFVAEPVEEGQIIFLEGEQGAAAYLIAEGKIAVLRHVRGQKAELLATLKVGDQFGINTLVEKGPRTASCVAPEAGWLYRLDAAAHAALRGDAKMAWNECIAASLSSQLRNANAALKRETPREAGAAEEKGNFKQLLQASGYLQGGTVDEDELDQFEVVNTEHTRRVTTKR